MPDKKFALEHGEPKRLRVVSGLFSSRYTIYFDGQLIGEIDNDKELKKGRAFTLPDGTKLNVRKKSVLGNTELQLFRNGLPLPESDADPQKQLDNAYQTIYAIGGLNIVVAIVLLLTQTSSVGSLELDLFGVIVTGIIYLVLGFFVQRRSQIALGITVVGFVIDTIGILLLGLVGPGPLVARFFFLMPMLRGFSAIRALNNPPPVQNRDIVQEQADTSQYQSFLDEVTDEPAAPRKGTATKKPVPVKKGMLANFSRLEMALAGTVALLAIVVIGVVIGTALRSRNPVTAGVLPTQMVASGIIPTLPPQWTPTATVPLSVATQASGATTSNNGNSATTIAIEADLQKVVFDPTAARAYGLDFQNRKLWFIDLAQQTVTTSLDLAGSPTDACVHPTQRRLYIVSWGSPAVTEIDLDTNQVLNEIFWPVTDVSGGLWVGDYSIYCQTNRLIMIDADHAPQPWMIDLTSSIRMGEKIITPQIQRESSISDTGIGDLVFTSDPNDFYYWYQFGWTSGYSASDITHARFEGDQMVNLEGAGLGPDDINNFESDPLDTPIFFDPATGRIIVKRLLLNSANLEDILYVFPEDEDIYAVDWRRNLVSSKNMVYDLDTFSPVLAFDGFTPDQVYFAPDSTLYLLSNSNHILYSLNLAE